MKKICLIIFVAVAYVLMGCYEGGDEECYGVEQEGYIVYVSTSDFDSAQVYLGNGRLCYVGKGENSSVKKKKCKTSFITGYETVQVEFGDGSFYNGTGGECLNLEEYPQWHDFACSFNEVLDGVDMTVADLTIEIFSKDSVNRVVVKNFDTRGKRTYFALDADTTILRGVDDSRHPYVSIGFPDLEHLGCYNGLCVFQDSFPVDKFCYEK